MIMTVQQMKYTSSSYYGYSNSFTRISMALMDNNNRAHMLEATKSCERPKYPHLTSQNIFVEFAVPFFFHFVLNQNDEYHDDVWMLLLLKKRQFFPILLLSELTTDRKK